MKVSKRERYALRMMIDIAENSKGDQPVNVRAISDRQQISRRYLEQIAKQLRQCGLVVARQGQTGGYLLARSAREISVGEVLRAVAGPLLSIDCLEDESTCDQADFCRSRRMWALVDAVLHSVLHQYYLDDLVENRLPSTRRHRSEEGPMGVPPIDMNL